MDKVTIMLEVPVLQQSFEMQMPTYLQIGSLLLLIVEAVVSMSDQSYQTSGQEFLCSRRHEEILNDIETLLDYKIQNGDHLLLI